MSSFAKCQESNCLSDAEYKCHCSSLFCSAHFRSHSIGKGSGHKGTPILLHLSPSEIPYFDDLTVSNFLKTQIQKEVQRKKECIQELLTQVKNIEKSYCMSIRRIINENRKARGLFSEIRQKQAVSLISDDHLASGIGNLKSQNKLSLKKINKLLLRQNFQSFTPGKEIARNEETLKTENSDKDIILKRTISRDQSENSQKFSGNSQKFSGNNQKFSTSSHARTRFSNPKLAFELKGHTKQVWRVGISPCYRYIASGSLDRSIKVWNFRTGALLASLDEHKDNIFSLKFNPTSQFLVSGSSDSTAKVWDLATFRCVLTYEGHCRWVWSACYSPNSQQIASGGGDNTIHLWNAKDGSYITILVGHSLAVSSVAFSNDGKKIVSSSLDKTVRVWKLSTGNTLFVLEGHTDKILTLCLFNNLVASGGYDRKIRVWDINSGECLRILEGHSGAVRSLDFSECGNFIVSGSYDDFIIVWNQMDIVAAISNTFKPYALLSRNCIVSGSLDEKIRVWKFP